MNATMMFSIKVLLLLPVLKALLIYVMLSTNSRHLIHEKEQFQEQQDFVYSVLLKILVTNYGKALVKEHETDRDAQSILAKPHQLHTIAELSRSENVNNFTS